MDYGFHILDRQNVKLMTADAFLSFFGFSKEEGYEVALLPNGTIIILEPFGDYMQFLQKDYVPVFNDMCIHLIRS